MRGLHTRVHVPLPTDITCASNSEVRCGDGPSYSLREFDYSQSQFG